MKKNGIIAISIGAGVIAAGIIMLAIRKKKAKVVQQAPTESHDRHLTNVFSKAKKEMA